MGLLDIFDKDDINRGVKKFQKTPGALLIDVRKEEEYQKGHIPGSINIPESNIENIQDVTVDFNTPIFVYCFSGAKSWNATKSLEKMGYKNVKNIGGINKYTGEKEV
jgi:rhodanese-related sulfurtransferase